MGRESEKHGVFYITRTSGKNMSSKSDGGKSGGPWDSLSLKLIIIATGYY